MTNQKLNVRNGLEISWLLFAWRFQGSPIGHTATALQWLTNLKNITVLKSSDQVNINKF